MHLLEQADRTTSAFPLRWRTFIAALTATVMVLFGLSVPTIANANESPAIVISVDYGTQTQDGMPVVTAVATEDESTPSYTARIMYDMTKIAAGSTYTISVPEGVVFPERVHDGNTVIESIVRLSSGDLEITFKEEPDPTIASGRIAMEFKFWKANQITEQRELTWTVGESTITQTVIVKVPGDERVPNLTNTHAKSAGIQNLNQHMTRAADGTVAVSSAISATPIPYTVTIESPAARTVTLTDEISQYLSHDSTSFSAMLTTWDAIGWNKTTAPFVLPEPNITGQIATLSDLELPARSRLVISYTASAVPEQIPALTAALQALADTTANGEGGAYSVPLTNTVKIGTTSKTSTVRIGGQIATPNLGPSIGKTSNIPANTKIALEADGTTLKPALDVTYTITANLTPWNSFAGTNLGLKRNVILTDTLPAAMKWADGTFLSNTEGGLTLRAAPNGLTNDEFMSDAHIGTYRITESGKKLEINIGADTTKSYTFAAKAQILSTDGMRVALDPPLSPQSKSIYTVSNVAALNYTDVPGRQASKSTRNDSLYLPQPDGSTVDDATVFDKTVGPITDMVSGSPLQVPFKFVISANAVPDLRQATLVDDINEDVFDISNVDAIRASITGSYAGFNSLGASDFVVTVENSQIRVTPSATFGSNLPEAGRPSADQPLTGAVTLNMVIPTYTVTGKQSLDLTNTARLVSKDTVTYQWFSEARSASTSYGDELEVAKHVYTEQGKWASGVRAALTPQGDLVEDEFIYRVSVIPHGDFFGDPIFDLVDQIPSGAQILGFVSDANLPSGALSSGDEINIGANLKAVIDRTKNTVTIKQIPGTVLPKGNGATVNFKVQVQDFTADVPLVNRVAGASATITPSDGYPLNISKIDGLRADVSITDTDARFTVTDPTGTVITDEAYVVNGNLVVSDGQNGHKAIVVPEDSTQPDGVPAGRYVITEQVAPAGYELSTESVVATIRPDGSSPTVRFANTPKSLFAIGDYTWIDTNRNGVQDAGESVLPGVTVNLLNAEGAQLKTTTTDANGHYLFDLLEAGDYLVEFLLTADQAERYVFTGTQQGGNVQLDSDADRATGRTGLITLNTQNTQLVPAGSYGTATVQALNGIDPTWDAGVIERTYAIGDTVWIDTNRDGIQNELETPLAGVTVTLTDVDGAPVQNISGTPVAPVTTDATGRYLFDALPAGDYKVTFTLTAEQSQAYRFTETGAGAAATDSNGVITDNVAIAVTSKITLNADNTALTTTYDRPLTATEGIDPTWDAGVFQRTYALGDFVWIDTNSDGVQDAGEPALEGVTVNLLNATGEVVATTTTNAQGLYLFDLLPAGAYTVEFVLTPEQSAQHFFTNTGQGTDSQLDSNADRLTGRTGTIVLNGENTALVPSSSYTYASVSASDGIDPTWDAGVVERTYAIGDTVWIDTNRDGIQNETDTPLEGVTVNLLDSSGDVVTTTTTTAQGLYLFDLLPAGEYSVEFVLTPEQSARYLFTNAAQGGNTQLDSDAERATGRTGTIDLSGDNTQLVPGGTYTGLPVSASEGVDPTWDAGVFERSYAISDRVWIDINRDGVQDDGEPDLPSVTVSITTVDGNPATNVHGVPVASVVTDENGRYLFDELPAGDYLVVFTLSDEQSQRFQFTATNNASDNAPVDSNAMVTDDPRVGVTIPVSLNPANTSLTTEYDRPFQATEGVDPTWDAGVLLKSVSVGHLVWIDTNKDGRYSDDEPGIPGVVLVITGPDGNPVTDVHGNPVGPQTTDENGNYLFTELPLLPEGQFYTVTIDRDASAEALRTFLPTSAEIGDREWDSSQWSAQSRGLNMHGESDLTLGFGFVLPEPDPATPVVATGDSLSTTGGSSTIMITIGSVALLLLAAGALLLLARHRRSAKHTA